jgi:lipoprotein-anchoring transpeptidase ErfK/SrfK
VVFKDDNPDWTPTPSMRERDPDLPAYVPPGPNNPLGTRALHLSWTYYRIHGTHDTRKIGRRSSSGCVGLYNQHIEELYGLTQVGTQVLLI